MPRKRFTNEQIAFALRQAEDGASVDEVCRKMGCLNASWFLSLADARERIGEWRCHDNEDRPHIAPGGLTPRAFANQAVTARELA